MHSLHGFLPFLPLHFRSTIFIEVLNRTTFSITKEVFSENSLVKIWGKIKELNLDDILYLLCSKSKLQRFKMQ